MGEVKETIRVMAKEIAKDCIVTDALARLIEQVIKEIHESKIAPLKAEIAALKRTASLSAIYADVTPAAQRASKEGREDEKE